MRSGALGLRQLGVAAAHCKLDSFVANFVKVLCGQEIYKYCLWHTPLFLELCSSCECSDVWCFLADMR